MAVTDLPRGQINHARYSTTHAQVWPDKRLPGTGGEVSKQGGGAIMAVTIGLERGE